MRQTILISLILATGITLAAVGAASGAEDAGTGTGPVPAWVGEAEDTATTTASVETPAPPTVEEDPMGAVERLIGHVRAGEWRMVAALILAFVMLALAKVRDRIRWFKGDRGGAVLVMLLALGGALSAALATDAAVDWRLFLGAVGVAWTAAGGFTWFKRLIWPKDPA